MKKILIIHHGGMIGGAGISCYYTAKMLSEKYDVVTYCYDKPMDIAKMIASAGITSKTYSTALGTIPYFSGGPGVLSMRFYKGILFAFLFARRWMNIIKTESPDLLILNSKLLCWYSSLARRLRVKCICIVRETAVNRGRGFWNGIVRRFLEKCDGVIFISDYDRRLENLRHPAAATVPDVLLAQDYSSRLSKQEACEIIGLDSNTFNILYVGGISKAKGIDLAVEALCYLKDKPVSLIVAGQGFDVVSQQENIYKKIRYTFTEKNYLERMKHLVRDVSLSSKVRFIGIRRDMADVYAASDVLLFPARKAHQARPAFEIGVQKKPVIISNYEMTREYIKDGVNGLVFEPGDPESLANAIRRLMDDRDLYRALGENNFAWTLKHHDIENAKDLMERYINEVFINGRIISRLAKEDLNDR